MKRGNGQPVKERLFSICKQSFLCDQALVSHRNINHNIQIKLKQNACCCHVTFNTSHRLAVSNNLNEPHAQLELFTGERDFTQVIRLTTKNSVTCDTRLTAALGSISSLKLLHCPFSHGAVFQCSPKSSLLLQHWIYTFTLICFFFCATDRCTKIHL